MRLFPEQLAARLLHGVQARYFLLGNDPLLLQESQDAVHQAAAEAGFTERFCYSLDNTTDWDRIFALCHEQSLFASRQILQLQLPEKGPCAATANHLCTLAGLLHNDILLILLGGKLSRAQENSAWYKALSEQAVIVSCITPEQEALSRWLSHRAGKMHLTLDDAACQLLCYCYEGNLLALSQLLEQLALLWPDGKLNLLRVEQVVSDSALFTPFQWINALLAGKSKRALHILHQLAAEACEPAILLRTLQRDLLILLTLHRQAANAPLHTLFDQHRIWQSRRALFSQAIQRLDARRLAQAVHLLTQMEIALKQDYETSLWPQLETLSLLLCHPSFPDAFYDV